MEINKTLFYLTWKDLIHIKTIKSNNTYHFKTISKIHLEWARFKYESEAFIFRGL